MQDRQVRLGPDAPGKIQVWGSRHPMEGDDLGEFHVGADDAPDDVDEVQQPVDGEAAQDLQAGVGVDAAGGGLVDGHSQADYVVGANPFPNGPENHQGDAQPFLEGPAEVVFSTVSEGRVELVEEVPVGLDLDAVHSAGLHAFGGIGVPTNDAFDVPVLGLLGVRPVGGFT